MSRDITLADTFFIAFTTRAFATGIPTVLAGTPVVSAYEDAGLTQITAGITLGVDHDGVVGLNMLTIVATGANGYEDGKDYAMVITTGTVDSVSVVGEVVGEFTIGRSAADVAIGVAGAGLTDLGGMSTGMKAEVNVEALDVLVTDTFAEPAQAAPGDTISIEEKISFIYAALINKVDVDATLKEFSNAAGTVIWKKTVADDGTNYNEAKGATGP